MCLRSECRSSKLFNMSSDEETDPEFKLNEEDKVLSVRHGTRRRTCPGCNLPHADHGWCPPHKFCLGKPDNMDCVPAYKNIEGEFHNKEKVKSTLEVPNVLAKDDPVAKVAGPVELSLSDEEDILVEQLQKLKLEEQIYAYQETEDCRLEESCN